MKEKILVSACLIGESCKYNGGNNYNEDVLSYISDKEVYLICPEVMGGLEIPRIPCEIVNTKVINANGEDKTQEYKKGASIALEIAKKHQIKKAILKAKSPSCGKNKIYDGSFSHTLTNGDGITASLLEKNGIEILDENDIKRLKIKRK